MEEEKSDIPELPDKVNIKGLVKAALEDNEVKQAQADRQPHSPSLQRNLKLEE